ncbi:MAG: glycosyltransferase family 4 protein [Holophagales bacterium]|nr:glycosyltransferase family 4 protein [Holophagales bacterium]
MQSTSRAGELSSVASTPVRHIAVEATHLLRDHRGIGRYVRNVLRLIPELRPDVRFTLYVRSGRDTGAMREQLAGVDPALSGRTAIEPASRLSRTSADVVWYAWNKVEPVARRAAIVVSLNDVASMLQLDHRWWKVVKRTRFRLRYLRAIRLADLVITISEFSAREIERLLHADPARIRVTLLGANDLPAPSAGRSAVLEKLGIDGPFFLAVGARDPRKNLATLHRAMELLNRRRGPVPLVECGPRDPGARLPFIRYAGYVEDSDLATLYRDATALVFPSRYEGFGLPAAEAMWAGGRVVCADASSLPEVVGEAGLYFPWHDAEALAERLSLILDDAALRDRMTREGRVRAGRFRWAETARRTLAVFDEAVEVRRGRAPERAVS